jgi:hypothetical protein
MARYGRLQGQRAILSDELLLKDFSFFAVEVVGSTANSLELRCQVIEAPE